MELSHQEELPPHIKREIAILNKSSDKRKKSGTDSLHELDWKRSFKSRYSRNCCLAIMTGGIVIGSIGIQLLAYYLGLL